MTIVSQLSTLESAGLIRLAQYEPDLEYLFRHTLVQDAAYATLLASDRKRLHRIVGEALEHLYPDRLNEYAAMLANHFQQAGDAQHAQAYFVRAGEAALAAYANQEAESQYCSALALPASDAQRASLLAGLGEALYRQSRFEEAIDTWREGIALYQEVGDRGGVARLYARSARAAWHGGNQPEGLRLCQEGLKAVGGAPESADLARLLHEAGRAYHFNGMPDEALPLCQQALEMAEHLGAVDVQADALATLGILPNVPREEVLPALRKAVELAESAGLLEIAVRANHNLGVMTAGLLADDQAAREHYWRAVELARKRGVASEELFSLGIAVGVSLDLGELAVVEEELSAMGRLAKTLPDPEAAHLQVHTLQALLSRFRGEHAEALELLRLLRAKAHERGDLQTLLRVDGELNWLLLELEHEGEQIDWAELEAALTESIEISDRGLGDRVWPYTQAVAVRARQGQIAKARQLLDQVRERADSLPTTWHELALAVARTELASAERRWDEALAGTEEIAGYTTKTHRRWLWARTLRDWADLHVARCEPTDLQRAQALLREARAVFEEMGARGYVTSVNVRLESVRAEINARALAHDQVVNELEVAGRIQEGLLPKESPYIPGWQLAATLEPARETSGDFYDFIPLPDGHLGIVVADVSDKGAGAALYMALSRTLLRTYAGQYPTQPELVLRAANERILQETRADMFVTTFYGILEPEAGRLIYCNAGHYPPYLLHADGLEALGRAALPLGILEDTSWEQDTALLAPGDLLVLYTDGVTDARAPDGTLFGQERLLEMIKACRGCEAHEVQEAILSTIHRFVGTAPRFDDLTLLVVARR
jgi:serine phosphatase RsbU (regulator of sigma subunit)/tetratricopeptide (TPR) repeat protein